MKADLRYWPAVGGDVWDRIRDEFGLPDLAEARAGQAEASPRPELRLVRVFIGEDTYCPGFQFRPDGPVDPRVLELFDRAQALKVPHNVFAAWMVTPLAAGAPRPVDALAHADRLALELARFAANRP